MVHLLELSGDAAKLLLNRAAHGRAADENRTTSDGAF
jgi:hypothetical protein